jgi:hypothetical protein
MVIVYKISTPGSEVTRLHLPNGHWGQVIRSRLAEYGYTVEPSEEPPFPDNRGAEEMARRDALLDWAAPDE